MAIMLPTIFKGPAWMNRKKQKSPRFAGGIIYMDGLVSTGN
jgi:hypothetical protein